MIIEQLISADTADLKYYSLIGQSQTVLWLADEPFKRRISRVGQTNKQTNTQINLIACWTATFAVKKDLLAPTTD